MAMPPWAYMEAQRAADLHIQVRIEERGVPQEELGLVPVVGKVVRVFHGRKLRVGDQVTFHMKVYRPPAEPEPDEGGWISEESLGDLNFLEVYLDESRKGLRISAGESLHFSIEGPTRKATEPRPSWWALRAVKKEFDRI